MVYECRGTLWYVADCGRDLYGIFRQTVGGHVRPCFGRLFLTREEAQMELDQIAEQKGMTRKPAMVGQLA